MLTVTFKATLPEITTTEGALHFMHLATIMELGTMFQPEFYQKGLVCIGDSVCLEIRRGRKNARHLLIHMDNNYHLKDPATGNYMDIKTFYCDLLVDQMVHLYILSGSDKLEVALYRHLASTIFGLDLTEKFIKILDSKKGQYIAKPYVLWSTSLEIERKEEGYIEPISKGKCASVT